MNKKLIFYCVNCGNEVFVDVRLYSGAYDVICKECEQKYADEIHQQQEEFLRKEESYLYE